MQTNLSDAKDLLGRNPKGTLAVFAVFVVSPLPSAQLFLAAGFLDLNLQLFTLAFFLGRLVSYSVYVSVAVVADRQLGNVLGRIFGSPWSVALQVALLAAVCLLPLVNWRALARRVTRSRSTAHGAHRGSKRAHSKDDRP